jgi:drug/metabolite transporter (DMT)-like permease
LAVKSPPMASSSTAHTPSETQTANNNRTPILLALLALYIIWGSTYLAMRYAVETIPPFMMTSARFLIAGALMLVWIYSRERKVPTRRQIRNATVLGAMMLGGGTGAVGFAESLHVDSGLAALAVGATSIWAALFAMIWKRYPNRVEWAGLLIGLFGLWLLNSEDGLRTNTLGAIALLIGPMSWAFASMWSRQLDLPGGLMTSSIQMIGGGIFLAIVSVMTGERLVTAPSIQSILSLVYLISFGGWIAFNAYMYLLANVRPALATSYSYVNPVVAVFLGAVFAGEVISSTGIVAMIVILSGVLLIMFNGILLRRLSLPGTDPIDSPVKTP